MNGVISNGRAPRTFSIVGSVVSVNCTWQLAHQEMTPVFPSASLVERIAGDAARYFNIAGARLNDAATMAGSAHHIIGDAERVHDVERQKRDVRRLEHVAAGVEHEIGAFAGLGRRTAVQPLADALAEPRQIGVVELHARQHIGAVGDQAEILDAFLAPFARLVLLSRHGDARHRQQEARIDALRTGRRCNRR